MDHLVPRTFSLACQAEGPGNDVMTGLDLAGPDRKGALGSDRVSILRETVLQL